VPHKFFHSPHSTSRPSRLEHWVFAHLVSGQIPTVRHQVYKSSPTRRWDAGMVGGRQNTLLYWSLSSKEFIYWRSSSFVTELVAQFYAPFKVQLDLRSCCKSAHGLQNINKI